MIIYFIGMLAYAIYILSRWEELKEEATIRGSENITAGLWLAAILGVILWPAMVGAMILNRLMGR